MYVYTQGVRINTARWLAEFAGYRLQEDAHSLWVVRGVRVQQAQQQQQQQQWQYGVGAALPGLLH